MAAGIALNRSRQVPAEDTPAFGGIAERFRRAGDLDRAVQLCRDGLKKFPDHLSARVTLGWALLDQGKYDDARLELEQALKRAPDNLAAIRGLAELHDRAEHTMMLPMDGPGQWPPDAETIDALQSEAKPADDNFDFVIAVQAPKAPEPPPVSTLTPEPVMPAASIVTPSPGPEPAVAFVTEPALADAPSTMVVVPATPPPPRKKIKAGKRASSRAAKGEGATAPEPAIAAAVVSSPAAQPEIVLTNSAGVPMGATPTVAAPVVPVAVVDVSPVEIETPLRAATAAMSAATRGASAPVVPVVDQAVLETAAPVPPPIAPTALEPATLGNAPLEIAALETATLDAVALETPALEPLPAESPAVDLLLSVPAEDATVDLNLDQLVQQLAAGVDDPLAQAALAPIEVVSNELPDTSEFDLASFALESDAAVLVQPAPVALDPDAAAEAQELAALLAEAEALDRQAAAVDAIVPPAQALTAEFEAEREHGGELEGTEKSMVDTPRREAARARGAGVGRLRAEGASASWAEALAEARPRAPEQSGHVIELAAQPAVIAEPIIELAVEAVAEAVAAVELVAAPEPEPVEDPNRPVLVLTNPTTEDFPDPWIEEPVEIRHGFVAGDVAVNDLPLLSAFVEETIEIDAEAVALTGPQLELTNPTVDDFPEPVDVDDDLTDEALLSALGGPRDFPMLSYLESLPDEPEPVVLAEPKRSPRIPLERFLRQVQSHRRRLMAESVA